MATRGRPAFQPTNEQRLNVEIVVGLGIPEEKICFSLAPPCDATQVSGDQLAAGGTRRAMAQTKPASSRAIAAVTDAEVWCSLIAEQ
jgi:hypothetical protein